MSVITTMTVIKLGIKLVIAFGGVIAVASAINWLNQKSFKKNSRGGGKYDSHFDSEDSFRSMR